MELPILFVGKRRTILKYHYAMYLGGDSIDKVDLRKDIYLGSFARKDNFKVLDAVLNLGDGFGNITFNSFSNNGDIISFSTIAKLPNKLFLTLSRKNTRAKIFVMLLYGSSLSLWAYIGGKNCLKATFPSENKGTDEKSLNEYMLFEANTYLLNEIYKTIKYMQLTVDEVIDFKRPTKPPYTDLP